MNKKKVSTFVLAGIISAQTLLPARITFADEIEKTNVGNEQVQNNQEVEAEDTNKSEVGNSKDEKQELENKEKVTENYKTEDSEKVVDGRAIVNVPDINLRRSLNKALGYVDRERELTLSDMQSVVRFQANNYGIESLVGLEYATNLQYIMVRDNNISDLTPLSGLKVNELFLEGNNISDISPLAGYTEVTRLFLSRNKISDVSPLNGIKGGIILVDRQTIEGVDLCKNEGTESLEVENIVKDRYGNLIAPESSNSYSYENGKVIFNNIGNSDKVEYSFNKNDGFDFYGTVIHNIVEGEKEQLKAELNEEKGGIMLSTAGLGLRLFTKLEGANPNEAATYYITTASDESETPKFEVKSTVLNGDYSQIKTSIEFSELAKLDTGVDTKLYVKRVVKGQKPTYIELKSGADYLTSSFNISDNKCIAVSVSKNTDNVVQLNKNDINSDLFNQGVSNIYWNSTGMVVEGTLTNNGSSDGFNNAKVSMLLKDSNGEYVKEDGTNKNVEVRGMYREGKYKVTIPYDELENAKSFELRLVGSNIQTSDVLTNGTVQEFKTGMNNDKVYKLSVGAEGTVNLTIEKLSDSSSNLSSVKVTTDKATGIRQFSVTGDVFITGMDKIDSNVKYTIVGKKEDEVVFEQLATKINNNGNNNGFKTNLSVSKLKEVNLNQGEEISLELKVEYLGNSMNIKLDSSQADVSITDKDSNEIFEMSSKDGKAIVTKK
ncbi:leucine-rich repeat domain-containing protein [Clostridium cuniculi]|uniref:leucine-rich repeat domain-containing protein n=1 Tax=Clostridium cuniculi TaxID=2548455 RepID=UPI001056C272|nr:leucine-rich repeat domain-containing protein [Clostridium cuniculi]